MYLEAAEGDLDPEWKVDEKGLMSWDEFREIGSLQELKWDPRKQMYPGDQFFRACADAPQYEEAQGQRMESEG